MAPRVVFHFKEKHTRVCAKLGSQARARNARADYGNVKIHRLGYFLLICVGYDRDT